MKKKVLAISLIAAMVAVAIAGATLAYFTDKTETVENAFAMGKVEITLDEALVGGDATTEQRTETGNDYTGTAMMPGVVFEKDPTIHVKDGSQESYVFLDMNINKFSSLFWVMAADATEDAQIDFAAYENGALVSDFDNGNGTFGTTKFINYMLANKDVFQQIANKWFTGINHEDWLVLDVFVSEDGTTLTVRMAYQGDTDGTPNTVLPNGADVDIQFMESFGMPGSVTQEMIDNGKAPNVGGMQNAFNTAEANFNMDFVAYAIQAAGLDTVEAAAAAMFAE